MYTSSQAAVARNLSSCSAAICLSMLDRLKVLTYCPKSFTKGQATNVFLGNKVKLYSQRHQKTWYRYQQYLLKVLLKIIILSMYVLAKSRISFRIRSPCYCTCCILFLHPILATYSISYPQQELIAQTCLLSKCIRNQQKKDSLSQTVKKFNLVVIVIMSFQFAYRQESLIIQLLGQRILITSRSLLINFPSLSRICLTVTKTRTLNRVIFVVQDILLYLCSLLKTLLIISRCC